ncbi:MAG: FAD-binding oxidoreductase [Chloroflexota bacterium]
MQLDDRSVAARFPAGAILPSNPAYDDHRISFNGLIDRRPAAIVPCGTTEDVVTAVHAARAAGLPIAVRGGGHSVAGHSLADDALVVSLAPMRTVEVETDRRLAHAGGGALWEDVDAACFRHGLAVVGGTFGDTGIGGLTLGGGIGWLMPMAGLTCDNLMEAEVVTADGSVVVANAEQNADLLWALRGGGGNFGVVTRFTYRAVSIGQMFGGRITYPASAAGAFFDRLERLVAGFPTMGLPTVGLHRASDSGDPTITMLLGVVDGSDPAPILDLLRRDLQVLTDDVGPMTYLDLQGLAGILPFGLRHYWKGHFLRELDRDLFLRLVTAMGDEDSVGEPLILLERLVGAGRSEPSDVGAAFAQRAATWNASALAIWEDPALDATATSWARRVADLLEPSSLMGGGYVNYSTDEPIERVRAAYGPERWERLVSVKRRYDPENVFRFNHNLPPA